MVILMTYYMIMKANVADLKAHLSEYLRQLAETGEPITVCVRNEPVAELRALPQDKPKRMPKLGFAKGEFAIPDSFFEPLPDDILKAFNGE
jgi:antitoxin (DNA-binding transcriptional repressor) of toxin-antitoxin stability system